MTVAFLLTKVNTSDPDLVQSQFYKGSYDFTSGLPSNLAGNVLSTATVSIAVGTANNEVCYGYLGITYALAIWNSFVKESWEVI